MVMFALTLVVSVAHAIQPPVDDAPPPPPLDVRDAAPGQGLGQEGREREEEVIPAPDGEQVKQGGFLGISVSEVPEMVRAHLDLPDDQGVMVRIVSPGSAADKAGLQLYDVILKVAGEAVSNHGNVAKMVAQHHAGDQMSIEYMRKGVGRTIAVTLDPRPANVMAEGDADVHPVEPRLGLDDMFFEEMPKDQAGRIREMIEQNLRALREPGGLLEDEAFQDAFRGMREQMQRLLAEPKPFAPLDEDGGFGKIQMNAGATVRLMDEEGSIELKAADDSKEVTVRDRENEIVWTGPWDTDQDKAAAPDDIRERIERLNIEGFQQGNGLKLQFFRNR